MFGYVLPPQDLPEEELNRFRRAYCGLCHTLGRRYGTAARFILNYDFTYLAILLSEREESVCRKSRCMAHPVHGREYLEDSAALDLAADESMILAYWQLRDGVADHDWLHGLKYRGLSGVLEPAYRKASAARPGFTESTRRQLARLAELEQAQCASIDRAADAFAVLLQEAASEVRDAADDLKKDAASGNYNPVALRFGLADGQWTENTRQEFARTLDQSIWMMISAFELWDFGVWTPVLQRTLYAGLFQVGRAVLEGRFRKRSRKKKTQERDT